MSTWIDQIENGIGTSQFLLKIDDTFLFLIDNTFKLVIQDGTSVGWIDQNEL